MEKKKLKENKWKNLFKDLICRIVNYNLYLNLNVNIGLYKSLEWKVIEK